MAAIAKKPIDVLSFVQVTPPALRERSPENDAIQAFDAPVASKIVSQVLEAIASGRLAPGTALPSHVDLAQHWRVNRNTVTDAFMRLRAAYAIEANRKGTFVTNDPRRVRAIMAQVRLLAAIDYALSLHMEPDDVEAHFQHLLKAYRDDRRATPSRRRTDVPVDADKRRRSGRREEDGT